MCANVVTATCICTYDAMAFAADNSRSFVSICAENAIGMCVMELLVVAIEHLYVDFTII